MGHSWGYNVGTPIIHFLIIRLYPIIIAKNIYNVIIVPLLSLAYLVDYQRLPPSLTPWGSCRISTANSTRRLKPHSKNVLWRGTKWGRNAASEIPWDVSPGLHCFFANNYMVFYFPQLVVCLLENHVNHFLESTHITIKKLSQKSQEMISWSLLEAIPTIAVNRPYQDPTSREPVDGKGQPTFFFFNGINMGK